MSNSFSDTFLATLVVVLGAAGTYLLLPHRHGLARPRVARGVGLAAAGLALLAFLTSWSPPGPFLPTLFLYVFGATAIAGGLLMITSRNPIYSALWFASVVLSTTGLFLLAGAPFLAAGTIIVYAGAIIVTFLFVIMLAQMEGRATYDRAARTPEAATITCYLLLWSLIVALSTIRPGPPPPGALSVGSQAETERQLLRTHDIAAYHKVVAGPIVSVLDRASPPTSRIFEGPGQEKPNVAGLGASLYTDHLVTVGLAGALLFVALIGAVAITNPRPPGTDPAQAQAVAGAGP
jgi:NADH-quinone oxidoreductase subunit J